MKKLGREALSKILSENEIGNLRGGMGYGDSRCPVQIARNDIATGRADYLKKNGLFSAVLKWDSYWYDNGFDQNDSKRLTSDEVLAQLEKLGLA
jgi:hypothetical protein